MLALSAYFIVGVCVELDIYNSYERVYMPEAIKMLVQIFVSWNGVESEMLNVIVSQ